MIDEKLRIEDIKVTNVTVTEDSVQAEIDVIFKGVIRKVTLTGVITND